MWPWLFEFCIFSKSRLFFNFFLDVFLIQVGFSFSGNTTKPCRLQSIIPKKMCFLHEPVLYIYLSCKRIVLVLCRKTSMWRLGALTAPYTCSTWNPIRWILVKLILKNVWSSLFSRCNLIIQFLNISYSSILSPAFSLVELSYVDVPNIC